MIGKKTSKLCVLLFCAFSGPALAAGDSGSLDSKAGWEKLFKECETDFEKYESDLTRVRTILKREIDGMSEQQYLDRYFKDDPKIRFVRLHWPRDFEQKDAAWSFYKECSDYNWDVRKALASAAADRKQKLERIDDLAACINRLFSPKRRILEYPFDRMVACYRKVAKH